MAMSQEELRKALTQRLGRSFKPQIDQILKKIGPDDLKYLNEEDVARLGDQAGAVVSSKGIAKVVEPARARYVAGLNEKAAAGDVAAQQELQSEAVKSAQKNVDAAKKEGGTQAAQQAASTSVDELLKQGLYADAVKIGSQQIRDTLNADQYLAGKSLFEQETGRRVTDADWQTLVANGNVDAVESLKMAKGVQESTEWVVRLPGQDQVSVGSTGVREAIQKYLPGTAANAYLTNQLMVRGKQDLDEAQWLPLLAAAHGVFDATYSAKEETAEVGAQAPQYLSPGQADEYVKAKERGMQAGQLKRKTDANSVADKFNGFLTKYGKQNPLAAVVATFDEDLAKRMVDEGLEDKELAELQAKYLKGIDPQQLGITGDGLQFYSKKYIKSVKAGAAGPTIVLPDREKIADGFRELYRSWFRAEPDDQELQGLIDTVRGQYAADAANNVSPDVGAKMKGLARSSSLYQRLMGNRPTGVSEEDYVAQMENTGRNLLGGEVAPDAAVQAGLQSGSANATVGAVYGDRKLLENNSSLRERIAQAAQLLNEMT